MKNLYWKVNDEESEDIVLYVYTENTKKLKYKGIPMAFYTLKGKLVACQFRVVEGSKDHVDLFSELGITENDRYIEKRQRKKKVQ